MGFRKNCLIFCSIWAGFSLSVVNQAHAEFAVDLGVKTEFGSIKSADLSYVQSRSMVNYGIDGWLGYRFPLGSTFRFLLGANGQFELMRQTTDPATVGESNIYGSCYVLGVGGGLQYGRVQLLSSRDLTSQFSLTAPTSSASASSFKKGSGFRVELRYALAPHYQMGLHYGSLSFKSQTIGATDLDLSANLLSLKTYGISVRYSL